MNSARVVTGYITVWIPPYAARDDLHRLGAADVIQRLVFTDVDMSDCSYTKVGSASVTVELMPNAHITAAKVAALRSEIQKTRADAAVKCARIEDQINKMLAIECAPGFGS